MSITPQAIKDQEFQIKFRGYDAIEVKAYLELVAEEFFELHEAVGKKDEEFGELQEQNKELREEADKLIQGAEKHEEDLANGSRQVEKKESEIADLKEQLEKYEADARAAGEETEQELQALSERETELLGEIEALKEALQAEKDKGEALGKESDKLRTEVELLQKQIGDLRTEDVEFKSTIVAAQKFADDVKNKAEEEAIQLLEDARDEVEMFRREAEEQLAALPVEIEELKEKKAQVREELRAVLNSYLEQLGGAEEDAEPENGEDMSDLFQSISLSDDADHTEQLAEGDIS